MREEWVLRAQQGDKKAFDRIAREWYPKILNYVYRATFNMELATEITQITMVQSYFKLQQLREPRYFATWIYKIATNLIFDHLRDKQREPLALDDIVEPSFTPNWETKLAIQQALSQLSDKERTVVVMKIYENMKFREIAEVLNEPESTIKTRLYNGLKKLKQILEDWGMKEV